MNRLKWLCGALAALSLGALAWAEDAAPPSLDDFLGKADFWGPELSPSGRYLSGIRRDPGGKMGVVIADLDADDLNVSSVRLDGYSVNWLEWATEDRVLVSMSGYIDARNNLLLPVGEDWSEMAVPIRFTRLAAMDRDGGNAAVMFGDNSRMQRNWRLSSVTSFLRDDPDHILMPAYRGGDLDLFKVNIHTGDFERVAQGTDNTYAWYVDRNGVPAFRYNVNRRGTVVQIFAREQRSSGRIKWRKIKTIRLSRDRGAQESATEFRPLRAGPDAATYYVAARPEGAETTGIYLYSFETDEYVETLATDVQFDIESALFDADTEAFIGHYYWQDRLQIVLKDANVQAHINGLDAYFGNKASVIPISTSRNGSRWLILADGPTEPGSIHVYDVENANARMIGALKHSFVGKLLAETEIVQYSARDGLALTGYLTRPTNLAADARPPLVMLPHGGPEARDRVRFDREVQYLASLGYQVFQPNFRGSSGFGKRFADAGRRQWGKAMQTDIDDGFAHLVETGRADADRACIMGYSYGGYAALAAATLTPDMYRCVIAGAAPADLVEQLAWIEREEGGTSEIFKYWSEHIGHLRKDRAELLSVSPSQLADRVTAPVLLIYPEHDGAIPAWQGQGMRDALLEAGKSVEYIELEGSGHSYRTDEAERVEYDAITRFLTTHLPVQPVGAAQ